MNMDIKFWGSSISSMYVPVLKHCWGYLLLIILLQIFIDPREGSRSFSPYEKKMLVGVNYLIVKLLKLDFFGAWTPSLWLCVKIFVFCCHCQFLVCIMSEYALLFRQDYLCNKCKRPGHFARDCPNMTVCNNCGLPGWENSFNFCRSFHDLSEIEEKMEYKFGSLHDYESWFADFTVSSALSRNMPVAL